jgi:hypothetical protein
MSVPRYALPAFAVLFGLLAGRVAAGFKDDRIGVRLAIGAGLAYVLAFGWVVTVMIESYPAELPYLARRIDDYAFLRASLQPFGAMDFLERNAAREDWVLNMGAYAPAYGHNPDRMVLINWAPAGLRPEEMLDSLRLRPNAGRGPELARALSQVRKIRHVYGDPWFSVYRVETD